MEDCLNMDMFDLELRFAVNKIVAVCQTGQIGDGIVWCTPVPKAFFIAK